MSIEDNRYQKLKDKNGIEYSLYVPDNQIYYEGKILLKNLRHVDKCCATCKYFDERCEGEGTCLFLKSFMKKLKLLHKGKKVYIFDSVCCEEICDHWEKKKNE